MGGELVLLVEDDDAIARMGGQPGIGEGEADDPPAHDGDVVGGHASDPSGGSLSPFKFPAQVETPSGRR